MVLDAIAPFTAVGATLGLSAGLAPGPMTALVIRQTLAHGTREGVKVALAPVFTDGPLLVLSALLAHRLADLDGLFGFIGLAGAAFLLFLAWESATTTELSLTPPEGPVGSVSRAIATNLFNPHPYLFWLAVGGPVAAEAWSTGPAAAGGFLVAFFGGLCGSKVGLAWAVGSQRERLGGPAYRWVMRALAVALVGFALAFAWDGLARLG